MRSSESGEGKRGARIQVSVYPTLVPNTHVLASVNHVFNAVFVRGDVVGDTLFYGRGAGKDATASAVLSDLVSRCADLPGAKEAAAFIARTFMSADGEAKARAAVEKLAMLAAAAALSESAPVVAEAFARTRLSVPRGGTFGTADLVAGDVTMLLDRVLPAA